MNSRTNKTINLVNKSLSQVPNFISLLRIVVGILTAVFILYNQYLWALYGITIVIVSDILDGWLARRYNLVSQQGALLDIVADKISLIGIVTALLWQNQIPWWFAMLLLIKELALIMGWVGQIYWQQRWCFPVANKLGKYSGFAIFMVLWLTISCNGALNITFPIELCAHQPEWYVLSLVFSYVALIHYYILHL